MLSHIDTRIKLKYSKLLDTSIEKGLKAIEPRSCSSKFDYSTTLSIEKAQKQMMRIQAKFMAERKALRLKLNYPSTIRDELCKSESPASKVKSIVSFK